MKTYLFTDANREEVLRLLRTRSYTGVRNYLQQLPEAESQSKITSQSLKEDEDARRRRSGVKEIKRSPSPPLIDEKPRKEEEKQDNPATPSLNHKTKRGLKI